jgi:hypothetical protein
MGIFFDRPEVMMQMVRFSVNAIVIIAALLSGGCWVKAAHAKVLAAPEAKEGVGFGGRPVNVTDHSGDVVDFLRTYTLQSKWNNRAALASAVAAIFAAISFLLAGMG